LRTHAGFSFGMRVIATFVTEKDARTFEARQISSVPDLVNEKGTGLVSGAFSGVLSFGA